MTTTTTTVSQAETLANRILDILEQQGVAVWGCYSEPDAAACRDDARRLIVPMLQAAALPTTMTAPAQAQQDRDAAALHAAPDLAPLYDIFYRLNRAALTGKVGDAVAGDIYTLGELLRSWGNSPGSNAESCPPPPAPTRLQQAVAAYRKLLDNRLRDHDAEYRARCEIADAAPAEAQESEE